MKQYKKYTDIPKKYRFDLDYLLEGKTIEQLIDQLFELLEKDYEIRDSKYDDANSYLTYLKNQAVSGVLMNRISNYISNNLSTNLISPEFNKLSNDLQFRLYEFQKKYGSETNRIFKNAKKLAQWMNQPEFSDYKKDIEFTLEQKKHKFEDKVEEFIKRISRADISAYEVFSIITNSELNYKEATSSKGKTIKITPANRTTLLLNKDPKIRQTTFENWANAYLQHKNSLASLLFQHFKSTSTWALERKYPSSVESLIHEDKADLNLLNTLYQAVTENINLFQRFHKLHKQFFKAKYKTNMKPWDSLLPLVKIKQDYSIEETQDIVKKALKPLGKEYTDKIQEMFDQNWIDYCIVDNKRSGAYSIGGSYGLDKKYILMNHDGKLHAVSTLAHEAGHSMHSWYSDTHQPYHLSAYPIFLAEIASIFNELLLNDYLMKTTDDPKIKFYLIQEAINEFEATVRRQTMWSEYEFNLYNAIDQGQSLNNFEAIKALYKDVIKKYSVDPSAKFDNDIYLYGAIMVPHYYYDFYVYKYAIGYLVANYFFQKYKQNGVNELQNYIDNFLKKGASKWPIELLLEAGVDLYDPNFYKEAFAQLANKIDQFEKLGKQIFKNK